VDRRHSLAGIGVFVVALAVLCVLSPASAASREKTLAAPSGFLVVQFGIQVDSGAADYVARASQLAIANGWDMVLVMNTPGGLLSSMQSIVDSIQSVESAGLRVYTWVPPADWAASAGSYIALATNAIYMGNGSFIGPSTPIVIGGDPVAQQHVTNAMIAFIVSLAQKNGYNATAARSMAENNTAYSGVDAKKNGLVTGLAQTFNEFTSAVGLSGLPSTNFDEPVYDQFLSFVSDPTVDGLFILAGMIAFVLDLFHRTLFITVVAVVMIALGFLGAGIIGAQPVAILILIIAASLIFIEVKAGHGIFATAGIILGLAGTYLLAYGVQWSPSPFGAGQYALLGSVAGFMAVGFVYLARIRQSLKRQPKLIDPTLIVNKTGRASTDIAPGKEGVANVGAEDWTAVADEPIEKGSWITVTSYAEGKVHVRKAPPPGTEPRESPRSPDSA
jgi:membrane-bound serine protease (ClpP class)